MRDLILNFSLDKLLSLPPTEFLAFFLLICIALYLVATAALALFQMFTD